MYYLSRLYVFWFLGFPLASGSGVVPSAHRKTGIFNLTKNIICDIVAFVMALMKTGGGGPNPPAPPARNVKDKMKK